MAKKKTAVLTGLEFYMVLSNVIKSNKELNRPISVNIIGESGCGKTSMVRDLAFRNNLKPVKINLAQCQELGDIIGLPITFYQVGKKNEDDKYVKTYIPKEAIDTYLKAGYSVTGKTKMGYSTPEWVQAAQGQNSLLLLDDFTRAEMHFQQAIMEIIHTGEYLSWQLPKGTQIVLTSNPNNSQYNVTELDTAQTTRCLNFIYKWDETAWASWAGKNVNEEFITYIMQYKEVVGSESNNNIRSYTMAFDLLKNHEKMDPKVAMSIASGAIGLEAASSLLSYLKNGMDKIPDIREVYSADMEEVNPSVLKALQRDLKDRQDLAGFVQRRLTARIISEHQHKTFTPKNQKVFKQILSSDLFSKDAAYSIIYYVYMSDDKKFVNLVMDAEVGKYFRP